MSGFNPFGSWNDFVSVVNLKGIGWKSLLGQLRDDDYRASTWTPGILFGSAATGITYTAQGGYYTKIGRLVMASYRVVLSSKGSSTGTARLTGLPFTVAANALFGAGGGAVDWDAMTSNLVFVYAQAANGNTTATFRGATAAATGLTILTDADFSDTTTVYGTVMFHAA